MPVLFTHLETTPNCTVIFVYCLLVLPTLESTTVEFLNRVVSKLVVPTWICVTFRSLEAVTFLVFAFLSVGFAISLRCNTLGFVLAICFRRSGSKILLVFALLFDVVACTILRNTTVCTLK